MSPTNHKIFFPFEEDDDLFDLYEERLFEDKQFFTSKPIISVIFNKRIAKVEKREISFRTLTNTEVISSSVLPFKPIIGDSIPEVYRIMQAAKSETYKEIFSATDAPTVLQLAANLLSIQSQFVHELFIPNYKDDGSILLSKEPNPNELAQSVKAFELAGGKNIKDLQQLTYEGKETLLHEAKRLSLWRKKEIKNA